MLEGRLGNLGSKAETNDTRSLVLNLRLRFFEISKWILWVWSSGERSGLERWKPGNYQYRGGWESCVGETEQRVDRKVWSKKTRRLKTAPWNMSTIQWQGRGRWGCTWLGNVGGGTSTLGRASGKVPSGRSERSAGSRIPDWSRKMRNKRCSWF